MKNPMLSGYANRVYSMFLAVVCALLVAGAGMAGAQETLPAQTPVAAVVAPDAAPTTAVMAVVDKGDVAWMLTSTLLVLLMTVPGLALFCGGMVRSKNVLSVFLQVLVVFSLLIVLWVVYGYSLAFAGGNAVIGTFEKLFLAGVTPASLADTFSPGFKLPEYVFIAFQSTFAGLTGALIVGAFAERMKFTATLLFAVLWFTFGYVPMAHMVWATGGFLFDMGALDFAGGTVVHVNAAVAALVAAIVVGKRLGYGKEAINRTTYLSR